MSWYAWYFHVPSLLLVALIYLLGVRALAALAFGWESQAFALRLLQAVTNPLLAIVGAFTPRSVPRFGVLLFTVVWLFFLLFMLVYSLTFMRVRPLWM